MRAFPFADSAGRQAIVDVFRGVRTYIENDRRSKEFTCRNLIDGGVARRKVRRGVQVRAVMLEHPETPREIAVLFHRGVRFGFEIFFVTRPRHEFVVDSVAQIEDTGFSGRYAVENWIAL